MKFADFVCFEATVGELQAKDRDGVIAELARALERCGWLGTGNCSKIVKAVTKREKEASTGIGKGVAVPHVKYAAVKSVVAAVGCSRAGIDFRALDKKPVYTVILLVSPVDNPDRHLQAMEVIFKHLQHGRFRKFLRQSETPEQVKELFREVDEGPLLS